MRKTYVYLPKKILPTNAIRLLFEDLIAYSNNSKITCLEPVTSLNALFKKAVKGLFSGKTPNLIVPHQSLLRRASYFYPVSKSILWITHSDPRSMPKWRLLQKSKALFCINKHEFDQFSIFAPIGIPLKVRRFGLGFDRQVWGNAASNAYQYPHNQRSIDVLFSVNYSTDIFYSKRKSYESLISLCNHLASRNLTVHLNGNGWSDNSHLFDKRVHCTSLNYENTPDLFRDAKLFVMISRYEGGNTAILEALASGCKMLSTPTGYALDFLTIQNSIVSLMDDNLFIPDLYNIVISMIGRDPLPSDYSEIDKRLDAFSFDKLLEIIDYI